MQAPLLVFDVDGTLCDTCDVDDQCFREACASATGVDLGKTERSSVPQVTDQGIVEWLWETHYGRMPSKEGVDRIKQVFVSRLKEELSRAPHRFCAIPGAPALLERLRRRGWGYLAATGGWRASATLKLRAAKIPPEVLACASDGLSNRTQIFRTAAAHSVDNQAPVVLVGDGLWDVTVAQTLGWSFVGVCTAEKARRIRLAGASTVLDHLVDHEAFEEAVWRAITAGTPHP